MSACVINQIETALPDFGWFIAKGKATESEPLYGISIHAKNGVTELWDDDSDAVVLAECDDLKYLISAAIHVTKGGSKSDYPKVNFIFPTENGVQA